MKCGGKFTEKIGRRQKLEPVMKGIKVRGAADRGIVTSGINGTAIGRYAGSANFFGLMVLGFRSAPPQALCCRPLRGLHFVRCRLPVTRNGLFPGSIQVDSSA